MADRLSELARQRALLSEHLAWLDREIADETVKRLIPKQPESLPTSAATDPTPRSTAPTAVVERETPPVAAPTAPAIVPAPAEILDQYRVTPSTVKQDVRKGCLLYFAAAFVLLGLVVTILYFTIGTRSVE